MIMPADCQLGLTVLTLGPSHDQVFFDLPSDIKRLSEGQTLAHALPFAPDCAVSPRDGCFAAGVARQLSTTCLLKVGDNHRGAFTICP
jgi:hypothetical protein